jgi:hypothetical protein
MYGAIAFASSMQGLRTSLKSLEMSFTQAMDDESSDIVANAVGGLAYLETLRLVDRSTAFRFAAPVINRLVDHLRLKKLIVCLFDDDKDSNGATCSSAVRDLLVSSTPLEQLVLNYSFCGDCHLNLVDHGLGGVLSGLTGHKTLRELTLYWKRSSFGNETEGEDAVFISEMLQNNRSVEELTIGCANVQEAATILKPLAGKDANHTLQELRLVYCANDDGSKNYAPSNEDEGYARLVNILPQVAHLKKLQMTFSGPSNPQLTAELLRAFERNLSLIHVDVDVFNDNGDQQRAIQYYARRNEYRPLLAAASKAKMLLVDFPDFQMEYDDLTALSLMLDTLVSRDDWFDTVPSSSNIAASVHPSGKKRRRSNS